MVASALSEGSIEPMGMPRNRYAQASPVSSATVQATIARSRRRTLAVRSAADDPVAGQVQMGELAVLAVDLELHRAARRPARRAADIGDFIFEPRWQNDLRA